MKVNKANMRLWVQGLRSGEFPQGHGRLCLVYRDTGKKAYCCLGVACEIAMRHGVSVHVVSVRVTGGGPHETIGRLYDNNSSYLPLAVSRWLGVSDQVMGDLVIVSSESGSTSAAGANDSLMWTFDQIADALVKYYGLEDDDDPQKAD